MKNKLIGIFVCMLLITIILPVSGNNLEKTPSNIPDVTTYIEPGNSPDSILGCKGVVSYHGNDNITLNVSFSVISYSLQLKYLGESSYTFESTLYPGQSDNPHIIPNYYGEIFTWVKATLDVNNGEQAQTRIGLSIGKWIHFFRIFL